MTLDRAALLALDRAHVWHPYTPAHDDGLPPLVVARAEGARFWDVDGRSFIDANSSWWVASLGHRHPRLLAALSRQSQELTHIALGGLTHEPATLLARELVETMPGYRDTTLAADRRLARVFYSDDGSTSVEVAIKLCAQYWAQSTRAKRTRFIALSGAFHGETVGATSVGGIDAFRAVYGPLLFDVIRTPSPHDARGWERAVDAIVRELDAHRDTIAAVVVEPIVQGAAGMRVYEPAFLRAIREACDRSDTFLVADEVFTGLGRTGTFWACEHAQVVPDVLCTAKALSGALFPFAATVASERIYDGFRGGRDRAFLYGHSYCGNPLGCAVAREVLAIYREERVLDRVAAIAPKIRAAFEALAEEHPSLARPRAIGAIGAIDLGAQGYLDDKGWRVYEAALARGVYLRPLGDTVYVAPPLVIDDPTLDALLDGVTQSIREAIKR
ncbi:MAG: adenosylmethionine--8-amino-7-oxononanoate transaminase [Myxococcales bacterium]|nr:adenosylmethionine--8-amino-7-oxononanoate transaminase [Myxococcales bacterium]